MSTERTPLIDWQKIRETVDAAGASLERTWKPGGDETREILRRRAATLAIAPEAEETGPTLTVIELVLASERYCLESSFVREVRPLTALTALPGTPPFVVGVVNIRGEIISVLDIGRFFELPQRGLTDRNKIVLLRSGEMEFAIVADSVPGIRRVGISEIQPAPPTFTGLREKYLRGITREGLIVLDAARLIHDESIVVRQEV